MAQPLYKNDCVIFNSLNRPVNSTYKTNVFNKFFTFLNNFSVKVNVAIDIIHSGKGLYHIESSQLICGADQSDG